MKLSESVVVGPAARVAVGPTAAFRVEPGAPIVIAPSRRPMTVVRAQGVVVEAPPRGAWDDRGWTITRRPGLAKYEGAYNVVRGTTGGRETYLGRVEVSGGQAVAYIADPPVEIRRHPKAPCLRHMGDGWFKLEWYRPARNVDDAILYVERLLDEAVNRR